MPVHDGAAYVGEAVSSLLAQTERRFVLVISDDASEDDTAEICAAFEARDPRVRLVRHEQRLGMTGNFAFVLDEATTPYFLWAAQDDRWDEGFLDETLGLLERDPAALAAMTAIAFVDGDGESLRTVRIPVEMEDPDPVVRARAVRRDGFHAIYALFRRDRLIASGVPLEDVPAPDVAFVFGLALHGRILGSDRVLSTRRVLGYRRVVGPDGRVVWEKALGADGRLYAWSRAELRRAMWRHASSARVSPVGKARLIGSVLRVWSWGVHRNLVEQTGELPVTTAWKERRYLRAGLLTLGQFVLRPRKAIGEARRRWRERAT